jgi:hypothetical protein
LGPPAFLLAPTLGEQEAASLRGEALDFALELFALTAFDAFLFLHRRGHAHGGQRVRVAGHVTVQAQGQLLGVALVVIDALVLFVQTDGLDDEVVNPQGDEVAVQTVAERAGFVATMHLPGQRELRLDPDQELGRRELLGWLGRTVIQNAHDDDGVGVNVQAQFEGLRFGARDLIRANFGGIQVLFEHTVAGCSALALARQLLMSSPKFARMDWRVIPASTLPSEHCCCC